METTLRTKPTHMKPNGSKIAEVCGVIRYPDGKPAQLLCLLDSGTFTPIRIEDLEPEAEVERVVRELENQNE